MDARTPKNDLVSMESMFIPEPVISMAIKNKHHKDDDKFSRALARFVVSEDPYSLTYQTFLTTCLSLFNRAIGFQLSMCMTQTMSLSPLESMVGRVSVATACIVSSHSTFPSERGPHLQKYV